MLKGLLGVCFVGGVMMGLRVRKWVYGEKRIFKEVRVDEAWIIERNGSFYVFGCDVG